MNNQSSARTRYLEAAYDLLQRELLPEAPDRATVALAYSWPTKGARGKTLGEYQEHALQNSENGETCLIVVSPRQWAEGLEVLHVLAHEMCHAAAGHKAGHRKPFKRLADKIGLDGPAKATTPGPRFSAWAARVASELPPFPAGGLTLAGKKPQSTRLRLWECGCPVKVRVASDDFQAVCSLCSEPFHLIEKPGDSPEEE